MTGLGIDANATQWAIASIPSSITLAFLPYAEDVQAWVDLAGRKGHEVLISLPLPSSRYLRPLGPGAFPAQRSEAGNEERLDELLSRLSGYVGVAMLGESPFLSSREVVRLLMSRLRGRELLFVDRGHAVAAQVAREVGVPHATAHFAIDANYSHAAVDDALAQMESRAKRDGLAVGLALPYRLTVERLRRWSEGLDDRGYVLVPVSAVAGTTVK